MRLSARHNALFVALLLYYAAIHGEIFTSAMVTLVPVELKVTDVSFQYPETFFRQLVSAVPRRDYALQNVSFSVSSELVLLTGKSDSGKTTLFQLIRGEKKPTSGSLILSLNDDQDERDDLAVHLPKPVYLELQPDRSDSRATTLDILQTKLSTLSVAEAGETNEQLDVIRCFCNVLDYPDGALRMKRDQLSASDNFKLEIILACLESVAGDSARVTMEFSSCNVRLPAPVLLLDEWLDKETTAVVQRVQDCLCSIASAGAVVCVVTHKPERWNLNQVRRLQLHRGRVDKDIPIIADASVSTGS